MAKKYLTENPTLKIDETMSALNADKVVVVTDKNVESKVIPLLQDSKIVAGSPVLSMIPGEEGKNIHTLQQIWDRLEQTGATRQSVVLNIGGGVVTDMGGFAASTYKRGVRTVNFPTTLLGAVDAATGGKTGMNYNGLKNEIGAFHLPSEVIISTLPFSTLSEYEILSGYAEMLKTAIISDKSFYISLLDYENVISETKILGEAVEKCITIKDEVVAQDPRESGLRKILNFGHTAGHAFESLAMENDSPVSHGHAVAHGMLVAMILSHLKLGFESSEIQCYRQFLKTYYSRPMMKCRDMEPVIEKMNSDKKNRRYGEPAFTLLNNIGEPVINIIPDKDEIIETLELYVDMTG